MRVKVRSHPTVQVQVALVGEGHTVVVLRVGEACLVGVGKLFFFFFFILRRMGKNKALAHHTSAYFHTRRVSI